GESDSRPGEPRAAWAPAPALPPRRTADTTRRTSSGAPRAPPACGAPRGPSLLRGGSPPPSRPPSTACIVLRAGARPAVLGQPILQPGPGEALLEAGIPLPQPLHLGRRRLARRIAEQPLLAGFEELLAPPVVQIGREPLAPTQLRHALLAPQPLEDDAHFLLRREPSARAPVDLPHHLLRTRSLAHRMPPAGWAGSVS